MTDKELLELAAKAVGYEIEYRTTSNGQESGPWFVGKNTGWWPLSDDGDALRLAVKLRIEPHFVLDMVHAVVLYGSDLGEWETVLAEEKIEDDIYKSTRRAIVRAASEIGKEMP